jgi:hypothetical protein
MARLSPALAALALISAAAPARAQVNTEALRADIGARMFFLAAQASFTGHVGNVNGAVGSASLFAGVNAGDHLVFTKLTGDYAEFSGAATVSKAFAHLRYNYRILPWLFSEVFAQVEENKFLRLALRQVDGVGARFGIVQRPEVELYYGTAWMLDYEKLSDEPFLFGTFVGPHWFAQRWSNYAAVTWKMNDRARISDAFYIQPRVNGFYDFRLLNDASLVVDIDKRLSVKIDSQVHYNSTPPSRVLPADVDTITSLVLTL